MSEMESVEAGVKCEVKSPCKTERAQFSFDPPPEAPVFRPTPEEFHDPLRYINEIAKQGIHYGIMKIIPPQGWKPPFALNYDNFKFKPRIQKINELEATTRIKLDFLSRVLKAVAQEGKVPKLPYVDKSLLDLHQLYNIVNREGGPDAVTKRKKWSDIATEMGLYGKTVAQTLRQHYESCIIPYLESVRSSIKDENETDPEPLTLTNARELRSLEFLGPGPKMPTCNYNFSSSMKTRTRHKKVQYEFDPLAKYMCQSCGKDDMDGILTSCKTCYDKYHLVCLNPPLTEQPKEWLCPKCMVACDPSNPYENFGFETAEKEYSLRQFGQMADKFKSNHFKTTGRLVPCNKFEQEYWRIMSTLDSSVTVEYGADLSVMDVGSGFPTEDNLHIEGCSLETAKTYAQSKWNLNNLSVLRGSALRHITSNISGMKVPWIYIGMCFSTFCWHNEDHWSYSINYLHWGEAKTWYGVSGYHADKFEREFKTLVPELFNDNSNILHELVTTMNPNHLMSRGVPIFRTDQKEGEFVVTFPRAYHGGFNQGFNCAEACNFTPFDWIHMGRKSVLYYAHFKRTCVFSHDELICRIAENSQDLDKEMCLAAFNDTKDMIFLEMNRRLHIKTCGIIKSERCDFTFVKDEDRQCQYCKTTCFLSAVYCTCSEHSLVCLDHVKHHCSCDPTNKVLRFQYSFSELVELILKFVSMVDDMETLFNLVLAVYEYKEAKPFTLCKIFKEARKNAASPYLNQFKKHVALTLRCCILSRFVVQNLVVKSDAKKNLSLDSINFFLKCLKKLPWSIPELKSFENLTSNISKFQNYVTTLIDNNTLTKSQLESCLKIIKLLNVSFNEVSKLERKIDTIEKSNRLKRDEAGSLTGDESSDLQIDMEEVTGIKDLIKEIADWNSKVKAALGVGRKVEYDYIVQLVNEGKKLKIDSVCFNKLCSIMDETKKWIDKSENLLNQTDTMYIHEIAGFMKDGSLLPVYLPNIQLLNAEYNRIRSWLEKLKNYYSQEDSTQTLLQLLWPRKFKPRNEYIGVQKFEEPLIDSLHFPQDFSDSALKEAFDAEYHSLMKLRLDNAKKKSLPFNSEKHKCPCGSDINELHSTPICCETCQTFYHSECFPKNLNYNKSFIRLPYKSPYCTYCVRTRRPPLSGMIEHLGLAENIKIKVPEYYILKYKVEVWKSIEEKIQAFVNLRDVAFAHQKVTNHEASDMFDMPSIHLHNRRLLFLRTVLQQIDLEEVSFNLGPSLWALYECTKFDTANRLRVSKTPDSCDLTKTLKFVAGTKLVSENDDQLENKKLKMGQRKRRNSSEITTAVQRKRRYKRKGADASPSDELPTGLLERFTVDQLRCYLNEEMCAAVNCLRPTEEEVHWVQCDGRCRLWFHMRCVNVGVDEVKDDDDYICLNCLFLDDRQRSNQPPPPPRMKFCSYRQMKNKEFVPIKIKKTQKYKNISNEVDHVSWFPQSIFNQN